MDRGTRWRFVRAFAMLLGSAALPAQELANEIVVSFPPETIQVEFSRPAKLRELPAYASLRERYMSPRLAALEASLVQLGIRENDIDQIVLGWQAVENELGHDNDAAPAPDVTARAGRSAVLTRLDGLAAGRFDLDAIARTARGKHILGTVLEDGLKAYCLPGETATCVVFLSGSLGAFGSREGLHEILDARNGRAANLASASHLLKLLYDVPANAAIWGIATGHSAVADWFKGWLPGPEDAKLDWSQPFETVEALAYSVEVDENLRLDINLDCKTPEAASTLGQLFQGLKLLQQLGWLEQNPLRTNPVRALEVETGGNRVSLKVTAPPEEIQGLAWTWPRF